MFSSTNEKEILKQFEPLVHKLAIKFQGNFPHEDLVQEGKIGLLTAIRTYDPTYKTKFITWAYYKVLGAITGYKRKCSKKVPHFFSTSVRDPEPFFIRDGEIDRIIHSFAETSVSKEVIKYKYGLYEYPELTSKQISTKLGIPKQRVDSIIYRFKKKVKTNCPDLVKYLN